MSDTADTIQIRGLLTSLNPGINPGLPGLPFLNPEIQGLEKGPGIAIPKYVCL